MWPSGQYIYMIRVCCVYVLISSYLISQCSADIDPVVHFEFIWIHIILVVIQLVVTGQEIQARLYQGQPCIKGIQLNTRIPKILSKVSNHMIYKPCISVLFVNKLCEVQYKHAFMLGMSLVRSNAAWEPLVTRSNIMLLPNSICVACS